MVHLRASSQLQLEELNFTIYLHYLSFTLSCNNIISPRVFFSGDGEAYSIPFLLSLGEENFRASFILSSLGIKSANAFIRCELNPHRIFGEMRACGSGPGI